MFTRTFSDFCRSYAMFSEFGIMSGSSFLYIVRIKVYIIDTT